MMNDECLKKLSVLTFFFSTDLRSELPMIASEMNETEEERKMRERFYECAARGRLACEESQTTVLLAARR